MSKPKDTQKLKVENTTLKSLLVKAEKREQYYLMMLHKFRQEMEDWGLQTQSKTYNKTLCILSSNPESSVEDYLETLSQD